MNNVDTDSHTSHPPPDSEQPNDDEATILLVDATPTAEQHATALAEIFDQVIAAESGGEAQKHLDTVEIDCIVSEYQLPEIDGLQLLETIREADLDIPFVLWTESGDEIIASNAIKAGVTDYIPKSIEDPHQYRTLEQRIQYALTKRDAVRSETDDLLSLFSEVYDGLTEAETTDKAFELVSHTLCEYTGWDYCEIWRSTDHNEHLTCVASSAPEGQYKEFSRLTESVTFASGEGIPGRVWATGSEEWITEISQVNPNQYVRTGPAEIAGLNSAFGVPIPVNDGVEGVLVCYLTESVPSNFRLRRIATTIAGTLGRYIAHNDEEREIERLRQRNLTERTKELNAIHHTIEVLNSQHQPVEECLNELVSLLPAGFQYPTMTAVRITCGPHVATTGGFAPANDQHATSTATENGTTITLEVTYGSEHSAKDQGSFLQQEQDFLDTVATIIKAHCEQRESREQLERNVSRYQTLTDDVLESMDVGVFILDSDFTVEWANSAVADYFGLSRNNIIGRDKRQLLSESIHKVVDDGEEFEERILSSYADNTYEQEFELRITPGKEREERWLAHWSKPITDGEFAGGRIEHYTDITELKRAQRSLSQERARTELALETTDTGVWVWDFESDTVTTFPEPHSVLGGNVATVEDFLEHVHPEDREQVEDTIEKAIDSGLSYRAEFRVQTNGSTRWVADYGEIHHDESGNPKMVGVITDISEQKIRQQELDAQRERFQAVFDGAFDAMVLADDDGNYIEVNDSAASLFGCAKEDLVGKSIVDFAPDDFDFEEAWSTFDQRGHERGRFRLVRPDGSERIAEYAATTDIVPGEHLSILRDITDQVEQEYALRQKHKNLRETEQLAHSGGWVYNIETDTLQITEGLRHLFGVPEGHEWTLPESFEYYHPKDRELLTSSFERCQRTGEPYDIEVRITTPAGHQRWIHERANRVSENGVPKIRGAVRDITEEKRHRDALSRINTATRALLRDESDAEIAQTTVEAASQILDVSGVALYLYNQTAEALIPVARSDGVDAILDELPRFAPGEGLAWQAFVEQELLQFDDVRTADDVYDAGTPFRSELIIPIGKHGVLLIGDCEVGTLGSFAEEISETLVATAETALDRAKQVQQRREQQREAQMQANQLEQVEHLNENLRTIIKAIIEAGSRDAIRQIVCDSLVDLPEFSHVWIGEMNHATDQLEIGSSAGLPNGYVHEFSRSVHDENHLPDVQAFRHRSPVVEPHIAQDPTQDEWRSTALVHEIRGICSLPIIHNDVIYGVLSLHSSQPDVFDEMTTKVLTELAEFIGFALQTINQRNALLSDEMVALTCRIMGGEDLFVTMAADLKTSVHIDNISAHSEDTYLVHFRTKEVDPEAVMRRTEDIAAIDRVELISTEESSLFEAVVCGRCIAIEITDLGATFHSVTARDDQCEIALSVPADGDVTSFVEHLKDRYARVEVIQQRQLDDGSHRGCLRIINESLTDRQADLLRTAYYSGYFKDPRERTGAEIAEALDISQPSFSKQLRIAQQKLLTAILS